MNTTDCSGHPPNSDLDKKLGALLLISAAVYASLIAPAAPLLGYDSYTHLVMASHLTDGWFQNWNTKWYGGFDQFSYPPLAHQLIALASMGGLGLRWGFDLIQLCSAVALVFGIYRYSLCFVPAKTSLYAAALGAFSSALTLALFRYGQLPSVLALAFLLFATRHLFLWLHHRAPYHAVAAAIGFLLVIATHHLTTFIAGPFFVIPALRAAPPEPGAGHKLVRFALVLIPLAALAASPFLFYLSTHAVQQRTIWHPSRGDYFHDFGRFEWEFLYQYWFLTPFIPGMALKLFRATPLRTLSVAWVTLFLIGLGGTTPIGRLVLGPLYDVLTLDRFSFWAAILMLPAAAKDLDRLKRNWLLLAWIGLGVSYGYFAATVLPLYWRGVLPAETQAVIEFMNEPNHREYRYFTLGFGGAADGFIAAESAAQSIDGNYHVARPLTELRASGIERLDNAAQHRGAAGISVLKQILNSAARYRIKYVFSLTERYDEALIQAGWQRLAKDFRFPEFQIWEHEQIPAIDGVPGNPHPAPPILRWIWGSYPALLIALLAIALSRRPCRKTAYSCAGIGA